MNKVKLGASLTLASAVLGFASPFVAHADDATATAGFSADTAAKDVLYPDAPTAGVQNKPVYDNNLETGNTGDLTLDYIPVLSFGTDNKIATGDQTYISKSIGTDSTGAAGTEQAQFIQVTDVSGTLAGWDVSAMATPFKATDSTAASQTLPNSYVTFGNTAVAFPTGTVKADLVRHKTAEANGAQLSHDDDGTGTVGTAVHLMGATQDNGVGTNLFVAGTKPDDTTFTKPAQDNVSATSYVSTITYTLTAGAADPADY